jgi:hypothetical protein
MCMQIYLISVYEIKNSEYEQISSIILKFEDIYCKHIFF